MTGSDEHSSMEAALAWYFERVDLGEVVDESGVVARFPRWAAELERFFANERHVNDRVAQLAKTATANRLSVRCPNCEALTQVAVDSTLTNIECSTCAGRFNLVDEPAAMNGSRSRVVLGRFELIERLGMGAFGSVWKARDAALDRLVAVKIPRHAGMTAEEQEKFLREARAAGQLRHPNIVSVHEAGRDGENVYIVSDFLQGVTLDVWVKEKFRTGKAEVTDFSYRQVAGLCIEIAEALHHAHELGVVHRDLKPANIMIDAAGRPHLMDFGLARRDYGEVTITVDGQVLGTPAYMSPEQAQGKAHSADRRSDLYSLGVILYQLLTGELPFRGDARSIIQQVIHDPPRGVRKLNARVPRDMETITLKCLEKEPAQRYQTAKKVADDLRRFLANEPIQAKSATAAEKLVKWSRRHSTLVGVVAVALVLLSTVLAGSVVLVNRARLDAVTALDKTSDLLY